MEKYSSCCRLRTADDDNDNDCDGVDDVSTHVLPLHHKQTCVHLSKTPSQPAWIKGFPDCNSFLLLSHVTHAVDCRTAIVADVLPVVSSTLRAYATKRIFYLSFGGSLFPGVVWGNQ